MNNNPNFNSNGQQPNGQQYNAQQPNGQQYNAQQPNGQQYNNPQQYNGQPQYNYQQPPRAPKAPDGKAFSVTALVLGICSAVFSMFFAIAIPVSLLFLACGIVGIVLAVMGRKKSTQCYGRPSGIATAGFVLSIIGTAISAFFILSCLACVACVGAEIGSMESMFDNLF